MSKFGTTRLITLSPFYMINNETRVSFSLSLSLSFHTGSSAVLLSL